jgi:hypothetical protein
METKRMIVIKALPLMIFLFTLGFSGATGAEEPADKLEGTVLFEDSFDEDKLAEGWTWLREHEDYWRLKDGGLEIRVEPGHAQTVRNALLREAPDRSEGRYAFEVTVTNHTVPTVQYEQAGITWYVDEKPVFKLVKERVDGQLIIIPVRKPMEKKSVRLRLIVEGETWAAFFQPGAKGPFHEAGTGKLPPPENDHVSLQCYHGPTDEAHWIRFDDFRIVRLPRN